MKKKILKEIMRIEFFAKRFGFNPGKAEWSLIRLINEDGDAKIVPAVYIGNDIYIDILADEVKCLINVGGCVSNHNSARVILKENGYMFENEKMSYYCNSDEIYDQYKHKFVFKETILEAKCLN